MSQDGGCLKAGSMLLLFNAALVGIVLVISWIAPLIPFLLGGALVLGVVVAITRRDPHPVPPTFERAEFRLPPLSPPTRMPDIEFVAIPIAIDAPRCLVCRVALTDDVIFCWRCCTPHHRACFRYTGTCAVYACKCRRYRRAG